MRGDLKKLVEENGIGFACDPEDAGQLAKAFMRAAALDSDQRRRMGQTAKRYYESAMSIDSGAARIEEILRSASRETERKNRWK